MTNCFSSGSSVGKPWLKVTQGVHRRMHSSDTAQQRGSPMVPAKHALPIPVLRFWHVGGTKCRCWGGSASTDGDLSNCSMVVAVKSVPKGIKKMDTPKQRPILEMINNGRFSEKLLEESVQELSNSGPMGSSFRGMNVWRK